MSEADAPEAPLGQKAVHEVNRGWPGGIQKRHRSRNRGAAALVAALLENLAHADGDVAEVDVDRAGRKAFVANGAVVGDIVHILEVAQSDASPGLLLVEKGLDDEPRGEDLVARRIQAGWRAGYGSCTPVCTCHSAGNA